MKRPVVLAGLLLAVLSLPALAARSNVTDPDLPRALPAQGPVSVSWTDPAQFTDIRNSPNRWEAERGTWVADLAGYLRQAAARQLPAGQTLDVRITDIHRAGEYEPWHGPSADHIRILKDIYPPRLSFDYTLHDASGKVLDQGQAKLVDMSYLMGARPMDSDPLRYEKRMIDQWTRRQLVRDARVASTP
ncbi:MAG: DUF3016 domain-containing protein [Pseudoxanthomonas spadix]|nr:MAG: DUF3016 domain-containing protein [Pseudoxanthomonas spadix]